LAFQSTPIVFIEVKVVFMFLFTTVNIEVYSNQFLDYSLVFIEEKFAIIFLVSISVCNLIDIVLIIHFESITKSKYYTGHKAFSDKKISGFDDE
jgi:hypothetical protein